MPNEVLVNTTRRIADPRWVVPRLGRLALAGGLSLGLLIIVFLVWSGPTLLPYLAGLMLAGALGWYWFQRPLLNLFTLIVSFIVIMGYEDGTQSSEVLWGLYYLAFLGHWFLTRGFLYQEGVIEGRMARVLLVFLILATASVGLTWLFGGSIRFYIGEWLSLSFFALYFPVREAVQRHRYGLTVVLAAMMLVITYVLLRNFVNYQQILIQANYAWQVTTGRTVVNASLLLIPLFGALLLYLHTKDTREKWFSAAVFAINLAGLVLSQTRGYWIAFAAASAVLMLVLPGRQRRQLISTGMISLIGLVGVAYLVLGDVFVLVATGILDRVLSIGSAATEDISLVNRWRETAVVMELVKQNPILGYGMGFQFGFWDLSYLPPFTHVTSFLHNAYVGLFFKFGLWGFLMVVYVWGAAMRSGVRSYRSSALPMRRRVFALAGFSVLAAYAVAAITSNPLYVNDSMFMIGCTMGVLGGIEAVRERGEVTQAAA
ncbi:MAG: O-antigen ligase family protein [Rhodothermales bacterium]|nr:O-antigen ligase family protein [Rhodothermales bacterium]MBO6780066.1 O-antigen ligase family protein [Rhodothermales bacterium]